MKPPEDRRRWNFAWANRHGFGFRLWLVEVQVYFYRRAEYEEEK